MLRKVWGRLAQRAAHLPWRVLAPLALAAISGLLAYRSAVNYLEAAERGVAQRYASEHAVRSVVVAARPVPAGTELDASVLARRTMPVRYAPRSAYAPDAVEALFGRRLARSLEPGEPLTPAALANAGSDVLAEQIGSGERALTIAVDDTNSHASLVRPGDHIDLWWVTDLPLSPGATLSARPLLEAVQVLATGKTLRPVDSAVAGATATSAEAAVREYTTLTLRVAPADTARIALAERAGELLIALRARADLQPVASGPMTIASLLGGPSRPTTRHAASPRQIAGWVGGRGGRVAHAWTVGSVGAGERP